MQESEPVLIAEMARTCGNSSPQYELPPRPPHSAILSSFSGDSVFSAKLLRVLDDVRTSLISISDLNWFRIVQTW